MPLALIILAAGQGTRMNSDVPKMLHQVGNRPLVAHVLVLARNVKADKTVLVVGHGSEAVSQIARDTDPDVAIVVQSEQKGTGHAAATAKPALDGFAGDVVVLFGDTPFLRPETLARVIEARKSYDIVVLGFEPTDPGQYGRLIMDGAKLDRIVEFKDANEAERAIKYCNSGVFCAEAGVFFSLVDQLEDSNTNGEYYLTDIVALGKERRISATAVMCDEAETQGVNSRADLAAAEATFQARARADALANGVTLVDPATVFFSADTVLGRDATVEPNVVFGPGVSVETGAKIRAFSHLEGAHVGAGAIVGPFARLRPGAELAGDVRIGNFVEIKNATIDRGSKVNHLSYIGDAAVGRDTNIGAGTTTCNYDGVAKHRTEIGDRVFVGSDTMFVAPVKVGDDAMTATGTIVTKDVPAGALAKSRTPQHNKAGFTAKLFEKFKPTGKSRRKDS